MTIDEAIIQFKEDAEYNREYLDLSWAEENEQVAKWLEELKFLRTTKETMYREIYNQALEDFEAKIKECCSIVGSCDYEDMEKIKEQLKKGNE